MLDDFFFLRMDTPLWPHPDQDMEYFQRPPPQKKLLRSEQKTRKQVKEFQKLGMERLVWGEGVS